MLSAGEAFGLQADGFRSAAIKNPTHWLDRAHAARDCLSEKVELVENER